MRLQEECPHTLSELRRKASGHFGYQCTECGRNRDGGRWVAKDTIASPATVPAWDETLADAFDRGRWKAANEARVLRQADRRQFYATYLASPAWRRKRALVLRRAAGVCEGCGTQPPTQVHHLTYEHLGDEFLWELRAVCRACHERAHNIDELEDVA